MTQIDNGSLKHNMVKDTLQYSSAYYLAQGLHFATGVLMRRYLGPYAIGIWSMLKVALTYCGYALLGVNKAAIYKIPYYLGKKDEAEANRIQDQAFSFIMLASVVASIGLLITGIVFMNRWSIEITIGFFAISVYVLLNRVYMYYILLLRARANFKVISKGIIFDAILNLIFVVTLVKTYRLYGLYIAVCILVILNTLFLHFLSRYRIRFSLQLRGVEKLVRYGLPLLLLSFLSVILLTIDRIMIARMLGLTFVGYYSIGVMGRTYAISASSQIAAVSIPRMLGRYGENDRIGDIKKFAIVPTKVIAYLIAPVLALMFFLGPLLVKTLLPQYIPGILALQILLISIFFISCFAQPRQFMIAINKKRQLVIFSAVAILMNTILNYVLIKRGYGIYGVAWGTSVASVFLFIMIQYYAMAQFERPSKILVFLISVFLPFVYIMAIVLLLEAVIHMQNLYMETLIKMFVVAIAAVPLFVYINRETGVVDVIFKIVRERIRSK